MFMNRERNLWFFLRLISFTDNLGFEGRWNGKVLVSTKGRLYIAYEGIRYAEPIDKNLRFKDPIPIDRIEFTRKVDCLEFNPTTNEPIGEDDCLILNIYIPIKFMMMNLPVLIWIYGSPFIFGNSASSIFGAQRLANYDFITVTMNYRVGPIGFASYENSTLPGNIGLKDQLTAVQWVLKNIDKFRGDPNKVTLGGIGSGAAQALFHLHGELNGKIKRGIAIGGTRYSPWALGKPKWVAKVTEQLAESTNCKDKPLPKLYSHQFPVTDGLGQNFSILYPQGRCGKPTLDDDNLVKIAFNTEKFVPFWDKVIQPYQPVVDGHLIRASPWNFNSSTKKVPFSLLLGLNQGEGGFIESYITNNNISKEEVDSAFQSFFKNGVARGRNAVPYNPELNEDVISLYKDDERMDHKISHLTTDGWFLFPAMVEAKFHSGPLKAFMFSYVDGRKHMGCTVPRKSKDAVHGDQLQYIFFIKKCKTYNLHDNMIAHKYTDVLADFVLNKEKIRLKIDDDEHYILDITNALFNPSDFKILDANLSRRMLFWRKMLSTHLLS